jgi:hypothetical protein
MRGRRRALLAVTTAGFGQGTAYFLGFVVFERARVRLLLGDPELGQNIKHLLALDLKLSG